MASLAQQGFEIIPNLFDGEDMASVIESLDKTPLRHGRAGARNVLRIESVRTLARDSRLITLASSLLGGDAAPFRATFFDKSSQANWLVVWHQDTALPFRERLDVKGWGPWSVKEGVVCAHAPAYVLEKILAVRIHLDDSDEQNGSLRVLPQTHKLGVLSDDAIHDLAEKIPPADCFVGAGGVLVMKPLLIHSSSKAKSENRHRRVLHVEYAASMSFPDGIELCSDEAPWSVRG